MTRRSRPILVTLFALIACAAQAQDFVADAFGLVRGAPDPASRGAWAGLQIDLDANGQILESRQVVPQSVETTLLFSGPKTIVAGSGNLHVVGVGLDGHGNLIADGTKTVFHFQNELMLPMNTHNGLVRLKLAPDTVADRVSVSVAIDGVSSTLGFYDVVADVASLSPAIIPQDREFRINREAALHSAPLVDRFGNAAPDGISSSYRLGQGVNRWTIVPSQTLSQQVKGVLITREIAEAFDAELLVGPRVSPSVPISVLRPAYAGEIGARAVGYPDIGAIDLVLGPFATTDNTLLTDGTSVKVEITPASGLGFSFSGWTVDGYLQEIVPVSPSAFPIRIKVETLIGETEVELEQAIDIGSTADLPEDFQPRPIQ